MKTNQINQVQLLESMKGSSESWMASKWGRTFLCALVFGAVFLMGGCGSQAVKGVHNKINTLESTFVSRFNQATKQQGLDVIIKQKASACKQYHEGILKIDLSGCPDDYKKAVGELADAVGQLSEAWNGGDVLKTKELDQKRMSATKNLNRVAEDHGLTISSP